MNENDKTRADEVQKFTGDQELYDRAALAALTGVLADPNLGTLKEMDGQGDDEYWSSVIAFVWDSADRWMAERARRIRAHEERVCERDSVAKEN